MSDINLEMDETYRVGTLPDKSLIAVKRRFDPRSEGEFIIIKQFLGGNDFIYTTLEDGYFTFDAALDRAKIFFNMFKEEK
jgi:hypothetical protein